MTTATDGLGLLDAIRADPADDVARLVYADWIDDDGQAERAEFIRVQVELARTSPPLHRKRCNCKGCQLRARGRDLLIRFHAGWLPAGPSLTSSVDTATGDVCLGEGVFYPQSNTRVYHGDPMCLTFRRGFVDHVVCTLAQWQQYGPQIVRAHPVTRVTLAGRASPGFATSLSDDTLSAALIAWANLSDDERATT